VFLLAILDHVDGRGRARLDEVVQTFRDFYLMRSRRGLPIEGPNLRMADVDNLSDGDIRSIILQMPFRKFE